MVKEENFGRDHWTVLVYAETRCVDYKGNLDRCHLREDGDKYPTRLKEGELSGHNDLSCLEDLDDAGYIDFRNGALIVIMTDKGWNKVAAIRRARAERSLCGVKIKKSSHGFKHVSFVDLSGSQCSIQESSLATANAIWLGVDNLSPEYRMDKIPIRMHLNQKQVTELLPLLQKFVETGWIE